MTERFVRPLSVDQLHVGTRRVWAHVVALDPHCVASWVLLGSRIIAEDAVSFGFGGRWRSRSSRISHIKIIPDHYLLIPEYRNDVSTSSQSVYALSYILRPVPQLKRAAGWIELHHSEAVRWSKSGLTCPENGSCLGGEVLSSELEIAALMVDQLLEKPWAVLSAPVPKSG